LAASDSSTYLTLVRVVYSALRQRPCRLREMYSHHSTCTARTSDTCSHLHRVCRCETLVSHDRILMEPLMDSFNMITVKVCISYVIQEGKYFQWMKCLVLA